MADDWQVGDLALCIGRGDEAVFRVTDLKPIAPGPVVGLTYTVSAVSAAFDVFGNPGIALRLAEIGQRSPGASGYNSLFFRKVQPRTSDAEDEETIRLLNSAPVREPAA